MTNLYELKMGAEKLEALKVLLENLKELEAAITGLNLEELKDIKSAFDTKYDTFDKFVNNLDTLRSELLSKVEAKGDRGEKGEQGERGPAGPVGPKGDRGESGQKGDRGESFSVNAVGVSSDLSKYANKEKGFSFLATDKGLLYIKISDADGDWSAPIAFGKGEKGDKGDTGPQGLQGERGPAGQQGAQGPRGERGETGPAGAQGLQGVPGVKGDTGAKGDAGERGPQGIQGPAGPKGDKGDPNPNAENSAKLGGKSAAEYALKNEIKDSMPVSAYVCFLGANGEIKKSKNISSIVRKRAGDYQINFIKPLDENYVCLISGTDKATLTDFPARNLLTYNKKTQSIDVIIKAFGTDTSDYYAINLVCY